MEGMDAPGLREDLEMVNVSVLSRSVRNDEASRYLKD